MNCLRLLLSFLLFMLLAQDVFGQGSNPSALDAPDGAPTSVVVVDNEGQVGIGGQAPEKEFHVFTEFGAIVQQPATIGTNSDYYVLGSPTLFVKRDSVSRGATLAIGHDLGRFYLYGNHNTFRIFTPSKNEALRMDSSGWVGLGNIAPAAPLDVGGAIAVNGAVVIDGQGQFVGDTSNLSAVPTGLAGGDLAGTYPSPMIADGVAVRSLNGLQDAVTLEAGTSNVEISPSTNNSLVISVAQGVSPMAADFGVLLGVEDFEIVIDTGFGQRIRRFELMMDFGPGRFSQATWVDPESDGLGVLMMTYTTHTGAVTRMALGDTDTTARYQTGASDGQDWKIETFNDGSLRLSKSTTFGTPSFPSFFQMVWVAEL